MNQSLIRNDKGKNLLLHSWDLKKMFHNSKNVSKFPTSPITEITYEFSVALGSGGLTLKLPAYLSWLLAVM